MTERCNALRSSAAIRPNSARRPATRQIVDISASRIIFISGQTALDQDGNLVGKDDFAAQPAQVFRNLAAALDRHVAVTQPIW